MQAQHAQVEGGSSSNGAPRGSTSMVVAIATVAAALLLIAISLWRSADSTGQQACIDRVTAEYPAAPVSAYDSPRATGSLKLSYDRERRRALSEC